MKRREEKRSVNGVDLYSIGSRLSLPYSEECFKSVFNLFYNRYVKRDREGAAIKLYQDYFSHDPRYNDRLFRRRFRMRRHLFLRIVSGLQENAETFVQGVDAAGRRGFNAMQKATIAMRLLAYNMAADSLDDGVEVGESTALLFFKRFCIEVVQCFGQSYLCSPSSDDLQEIMDDNAALGWPGLLGSLDCMHWRWLQCPVAWSASYTGMCFICFYFHVACR